MKLLLICCLPLLASSAAAAEDIHDWSNLSREIAPQARIQVVKSDKKTVSGKFQGVSKDALQMTVDGAGETSIPRDSIFRVSRLGKSHKVMNAVLLGIVGGVAGAGAFKFGIACGETNDGCTYAKVAAVAGAAGGAAIGALLPPGYAVVYRKP